MEFSPFNTFVKLCLHGLEFEDKNQREQAKLVFHQATQMIVM